MSETDAGRLNRLLVIKSKGTTLNSFGEPNHSTYSEYTSLWGNVAVSTATEKFVANSDHPFQVVSFKTRYRDDINTDMVIEYDGYRYDIEGIKRLGQRRKKHMVITALRDESIPVVLFNYFQPDGLSFYLQPGGDKYIQP